MITLNLIPPAIKHDYQTKEQLRHWLRALAVITLTVAVATAGAVGLWVMLGQHAQTVKKDLAAYEQQRTASSGKDITSTTSQLNTTIKVLTSALGEPQAWSSQATTVLNGLPTAIVITSLNIQRNGQFHLIGVADSRQSFVQLETTLKANTSLSNVATTSTASKRTAVPFDFTGTIVPPPAP